VGFSDRRDREVERAKLVYGRRDQQRGRYLWSKRFFLGKRGQFTRSGYLLDGSGMKTLSPMEVATDLNHHGDVVGNASFGKTYLYLNREAKVFPINDLLDPSNSASVLNWWHGNVPRVKRINDRGMIAGDIPLTYSNYSTSQAFMLIPVAN